MRVFIIFLPLLVSLGCGNPEPTKIPVNISSNVANANVAPKTAPVPVYDYTIVNTYPHDPKAFTQGLTYHDGFLYEGTGGKDGDNFYSWLRKVEIKSGKVLQQHDLSRDYFGEGITILNDKVYQLTWKEGVAFVYNLSDFKPIGEFRYSGEGWGLTDDGTHLYMSDGTHVIRVVNPEDFKTIRTIVVNDEKGQPLMNLNELEWVRGEIWANVWQSGWLMRIDPATGRLLGRIDLRKVTEEEQRQNRNADVLNGIAYDEEGDRIFVTGKMWRRMFEISLTQRP